VDNDGALFAVGMFEVRSVVANLLALIGGGRFIGKMGCRGRR